MSFVIIAPAFCQDKTEDDEPIICNGDKIEYLEGNKRLIGSGKMTVTYKNMNIAADKVEVNLQEKEAYATGNVTLTEGSSAFKADSILYNFQKQTGKLMNGSVNAPPWYGRCSQIDKVSEGEYILGTGYISTCDRIPPHYKIRTKQVRIYLDDKIEAKNVIICAGSVPIMYLPVYTHNVRNKKPMVALLPGHSKEWGYYNLTAMRYDLSEQQQGKIHMDIRSQKGFASGITHNYSLDFLNPKNGQGSVFEGLGSGIFNFYYTNEDDKNQPRQVRRQKQRYRAQARHKWQIDKKTAALAEYNKLTDKRFIKDYFYRQEYINEAQPKTYIYLSRIEPSYSSGFLCQGNINQFFSETEYLPKAQLDIKKQRLVEQFPIYYNSGYSAANLTKKNASSDIDDDASRLDGYNELSAAFFGPGFLSVSPYVGTRQSFYSKDKYGDDNHTRGVLYSGVDTSAKFYRTYNFNADKASADMSALRHIVTPLVRYKYIHSPTLPADRLAAFDDIDTISGSNALTFALENNFQAKKSKPAQSRYDTVDLARFLVSADYVFKKTPGGELSNIIADLELAPSRNFLIESDASLNPHSRKFDTANLDFVAKGKDGAKLGLGHRYQKKENSEMVLDGFRPLTRSLGVRCYERYQFYGRDLKEQEYGLSYDLHCWTVDVNLNIAAGSALWVIFRLKAFPDFPVQLGTTYESPKPETIGG